MKTRIATAIAFVALCLALLQNSKAWGLRCHGQIVSTGDHKHEVLAKCGEPSWVETHEEVHAETYGLDFHGIGGSSSLYSDFQRIITVVVEEWTYNFGPHRLIYYLTFENGILTRIDTGPRGYLEK